MWGVLSALVVVVARFLSMYNKMDMGGYVRGVFCPYTAIEKHHFTIIEFKIITEQP